MSKLIVGDRVTCIDARPLATGTQSGLVQDKDYIIHSEEQCTNCKDTGVTVGVPTPKDWIGTRCSNCGTEQPLRTNRCYDPRRFRKVEEKPEQMKQISYKELVEEVMLSEN